MHQTNHHFKRSLVDSHFLLREQKKGVSQYPLLNAVLLSTGYIEVSRNNEWLAYALDLSGDEKYQLAFKHLPTGKVCIVTNENKYIFSIQKPQKKKRPYNFQSICMVTKNLLVCDICCRCLYLLTTPTIFPNTKMLFFVFFQLPTCHMIVMHFQSANRLLYSVVYYCRYWKSV